MTFRYEHKNKFFIRKIFGTDEKKGSMRNELSLDSSAEFGASPSFSTPASPLLMKNFSDEKTKYSRLRSVTFNGFASPISNISDTKSFRVFAATWNVGGKPPHDGMNLNDFLPADGRADVYVLGFQEIVPLNAGNVLVIEDNEPAGKWLSLINQALNRPPMAHSTSCPNTPLSHINSFSSRVKLTGASLSRDSKTTSNLLFFQKPSLKAVSEKFRSVHGRRLKACNCASEVVISKSYPDSCFRRPRSYVSEDDSSEEDEEEPSSLMASDIYAETSASTKQQRYSLVASKQMVGIFITVWVRRELVQHVGHLRLSCVGRGIMGYLGNKGCISVSMSLHQTSFCFICCHLASGEKEGDELRRNSDVIGILKNTQFPIICKARGRRNPERILEHDRVIWLGDLNYRIALSYSETRKLLHDNDCNALFEKDQLKIEREAGRVFIGWNEGKIYFAPTYKYSKNSDAYAGDTGTSKKKRRTPSWCDRILWHGDGIVQLSYIRGESRFSDHRPVCAVFAVEVGVVNGRLKKGLSNPNMKVGIEELLPPTSGYFSAKNIGSI